MERIAVYGAGTIGSCQATLIIGNGLPCTVIGHSERGLERCRKSIEQNWDDLIAEGLATEGNKQAAMALVTITNDPAALQEHTFVFEAVAEGTEEKRAVYETIEQNAAPNVVIASCTSSIDAEILAGLVSHPERLLIAHPFQPVHMLPLVEVVRHEKTAEDTVTRTLALLETLHRQVVVLNRSVPGFLVNRFAQALFRESIYLIEQGVTTAADIDRAVKYAVGMHPSACWSISTPWDTNWRAPLQRTSIRTCAAPGSSSSWCWTAWPPARPGRRRGRACTTGLRRTRTTSAAVSRARTLRALKSGPCPM